MKLIACIDSNNGIGKNNSLPWDGLIGPEDLKRFKSLTKNQAVIMGNNTYESIISRNGGPLPFRDNIVITTKKVGWFPPGFKSISPVTGKDIQPVYFTDNIWKIARDYKNGWVIGGEQIYKLFMPYIKEAFITRLDQSFDCDTFLPELPSEVYITYFDEKVDLQKLLIKNNE